MAGEFLLQFFEARERVSFKPNGEADVLCPFPHDKGYEQRPSAHINTDKALFHCKTCRAEGRFNDGGLSEVGFISEYYKVSYAEAIKMATVFDGAEPDESWDVSMKHLLANQEMMNWLAARGIDRETVIEYQLGQHQGYGITYPVFMNGIILDRRVYNVNRKPDEAKIKSEKGASALLFPFDHWKDDERPTLLVGGENDALLARVKGFNGLTSTFGEGSFPPMFVGMFNGKNVYLCYDCDEAGKKGALTVAYILHNGGANVFLVDLGLAGTKDDKDLTDYFIKHGKTADELQVLIDNATLYSGEMYQEDKNRQYPIVNLWEVVDGKYSGKHISSRVQMMGKYDSAMRVPTAIQWECFRPIEGNTACESCRLRNKSGWWTLDENNLDSVLEMVEVTKEKQTKTIKRMLHIPEKCPSGCRVSQREKKHVWKMIFSPDVESESEITGFRMAEQIAYVIAHNLDDGQKYRAYMKMYPHPQTQNIVAVVDRVEESDNSINMFKLTEEIKEQLKQFQGDPFEQMNKRWELAKTHIHPSSPRMVAEAVNIMYHSVMDFRFGPKMLNKGNPEGLIVGESRTGKTETSKQFQQLYGIGNFTNCKGASVAGLMGGVTEGSGMAGHRIRWGVIPRNNNGLVVLDELSGMGQSVMSALTFMRSERVADLNKIASGKAPAKTRLLWLSNPRTADDGKSRPIALYPNGVDVITELVGSQEDIGRFDFIVTLPPNKVYISPLTEEALNAQELDTTPYRNLIYWAWSRTADQVKYAPKVEEYIWAKSEELNEKYDSHVLLFGAEAYKKIARIAVAVAAMCFSNCDDESSVMVQKEHVDWACDFLVRCYDNSIFRLPLFVEQYKKTTTTNEQINTVFAGLVKSQGMIMKTLSNGTGVTMNQLQLMSGLDRDQFGGVISNLANHGLIDSTQFGITPTMRFRLAQEAYINALDKQRLTPLSQKGDIPL